MPGKLQRDEREPFVTRDGSTVLELAHPSFSDATAQSLAEARVPAGGETIEHYHRRSEEIYSFTGGSGRMRLGADEFPIRAGETVVIAAGVPHKLWNTGDEDLVLLCCCAPPYSHEDTVLSE